MKDAGAATRLDRRHGPKKNLAWGKALGLRVLGCLRVGAWDVLLPRGILSSLIGHGLACTRRALSLVMHKG